MYTPESYNTRRQAADDAANDIGEWPAAYHPPTRTPEEMGQRAIGEAERIASTLLAKPPIGIGILSRYMAYLTDDIANGMGFHKWMEAGAPYIVRNDGYSPDRPATPMDAASMTAHGYAATYEEVLHRLDYSQSLEPGDRPQWQHSLDSGIASAVLQLCIALADHRQSGEPNLEQTRSHANGLYAITTSLAAAVVEYNQRVVDVALNAAYRDIP